MMFDTDILIWVFRGNSRAARFVENAKSRSISIVTHIELMQGVRNRSELRQTKGFLTDLGFLVLPLSENIGHRAAIYVEEYGLSGGLTLADALIAATAVEANEVLATGNRKHYRPVKELEIKAFRH